MYIAVIRSHCFALDVKNCTVFCPPAGIDSRPIARDVLIADTKVISLLLLWEWSLIEGGEESRY